MPFQQRLPLSVVFSAELARDVKQELRVLPCTFFIPREDRNALKCFLPMNPLAIEEEYGAKCFLGLPISRFVHQLNFDLKWLVLLHADVVTNALLGEELVLEPDASVEFILGSLVVIVSTATTPATVATTFATTTVLV